MASATCIGKRAFLFPAGTTAKVPWSSSTRAMKRPFTTDDSDGGPDAAVPLEVDAQEAKSAAATTSTKARSGLGSVRTGHSLPAPWR